MPITGNRRVFGGGTGTRGIKFIPDANTVLWLLGQDDAYSATIKDKSGKNNHGTIVGVTWTRLPSGLWGLDFDGTDDTVSLASSVTKGLTGLTVLAWIKPTDLSRQLDIVSDYTASTDVSISFEVRDVAATGTWKLGGWLKSDNNVWQEFNGNSTTLVYGRFYLVAVTWNLSAINLYINGASDVTPISYVDTQLEATVTANTVFAGTAINDFKGIMALPRIFNSALSSASLVTIFNRERHLFGI